MNQFKPGDLAMTINLRNNSGKSVELISHLGRPQTVQVQGREIYNYKGVDIWLCQVLGEPIRPGRNVAESLGIKPMEEVPIPTNCLMPLRGDSEPVSEQQRELTT